MNGIANERLGQSLQAVEQAFSDFFQPGQSMENRRKDSETMRSIVAEILFVLQSDKKDADFIPHVLMEKEKHEWSECELLSEALINEYHVPKNAALAVTMLAWCKYLLRTDLDAVVIWAEQVWNVTNPDVSPSTVAQEGIARFQDFISQCGLSVTLREYGLRNFDSRRVAFRIARTDAVEVPTESDIQAIYELAKG